MLHLITAMRIALVDSTPAAQALVARALEVRAHEVLCFTQGSQALERIRADAGVESPMRVARPFLDWSCAGKRG